MAHTFLVEPQRLRVVLEDGEKDARHGSLLPNQLSLPCSTKVKLARRLGERSPARAYQLERRIHVFAAVGDLGHGSAHRTASIICRPTPSPCAEAETWIS